MFKNYFKIAFRNIRKDGWFSLLNVAGLTIGITFSLFLIFYIVDELNYDKHNEKADRICRINSYIKEPDKHTDWTSTQLPLGPTLKNEFPEVEESVRFMNKERTLFKNGEKSFYETKLYFADSNIFKVFTHKFLEGNPATALNAPNSIVISRSTADKYFGKNVSAIGKSLRTVYDVYNVTGVMEDMPHSTHIYYDMLISMSTALKEGQGLSDNWGSFFLFTYVLLKPETNAASFEKKLQPMYDKYMAPIFAQYNIKIRYGVQPITDIHLNSKLDGEPEELGSMNYIWIFGAVAFFMLLIACINYMNLTTARSARRAKEIGIRKVAGSSRKQLVFQFLSESFLTAFFAVILSVVLVLLLMHTFNSISGKSFSLNTLFQPFNIILLFGIALFTGFVGGSYPALYLSKFMPVSILKGALSKASGNINLRRLLVVLQFSISMIMLICTWIVYEQLNYVRKKDLGFTKDQVMTLTVNTGEDERSKINAMNNDFRSMPGIKSVGTGNAYPGSGNISLNLFTVETNNGFIDKGVECYQIDENLAPTLEIKMVKGRNFQNLSDTLHSILVNEAMVKNFNWDEPLGKRIKFPGDTSGDYREVVGVMKDFNQKSLYNPIAPLLLFYSADNNIIQLKLDGNNVKNAITKAEAIWKKYFPALPFEYKFLDEDYYSQYEADQKRGKIFAAFSILTIIITCLGLLGLTAFTTQQKQKEISVRRVLGASTMSVVSLTSKNYIWLALIAAIIAFPVSWYFMDKWLDIFPFNGGMSIWPFLIAMAIITLTAWLTASFFAAKAANTNPAKVLRSE